MFVCRINGSIQIAFIDTAIVLFMFMLSFTFVIECGLFEWKRICAVFFYHLFLSMCIAIGDPVIRTGGLGFNPAICVPVPNLDLDFHRHMSWYFVFSKFSSDDR